MPFLGATAVWTPLPVPVPLLPPDFHLCDPFYGDRLSYFSCIQAAGRLPTGNTFVTYGRDHMPYSLPTTIQWGGCQVKVAYAYPDDEAALDGHIFWRPDVLRNAASLIISQCVAPFRWGGFATISLSSMVHWITNDTTTDAQISNGPWPVNSVFVTVTVSQLDADNEKNRVRDRNPGFVDPSVAEALADGMWQARTGTLAGARRLSSWASRMSRGSSFPWWAAFTERTAARERDRMAYVCDAKLGSPLPADCSRLRYSELGPPSDSLTVGPRFAVKTVVYGTCKVAITATTDVVLTWSQITAAVSSLIDECVKHPLRVSRGGRAHGGGPLTGKVNSRGIQRNELTAVGGTHALPRHVSITLSRQN